MGIWAEFRLDKGLGKAHAPLVAGFQPGAFTLSPFSSEHHQPEISGVRTNANLLRMFDAQQTIKIKM